jgi:hypothetical protein
MGPIVAMVHGDNGPCFNAVGAHLKSLADELQTAFNEIMHAFLAEFAACACSGTRPGLH